MCHKTKRNHVFPLINFICFLSYNSFFESLIYFFSLSSFYINNQIQNSIIFNLKIFFYPQELMEICSKNCLYISQTWVNKKIYYFYYVMLTLFLPSFLPPFFLLFMLFFFFFFFFFTSISVFILNSETFLTLCDWSF